jgi:hypothetical protein
VKARRDIVGFWVVDNVLEKRLVGSDVRPYRDGLAHNAVFVCCVRLGGSRMEERELL